jgi:8-oxo-dGTP pyrophosphatase MutT (NUDIX family)
MSASMVPPYLLIFVKSREYPGYPMSRQRLIELIDDYGARHPDETAVVERFRDFVRAEPRCFERDCWAGHVTGSAWLMNRPGTHVLLTHHRKLGRWLQLGGHSDGDPDTLAVAIREAEEESGLTVEVLDPAIFDLDVHEIPARRSDPSHYHFDVRFCCVAGGETFSVSRESIQLSWVELSELEGHTSEQSILRMARKWIAVRGAGIE